MSKKLIIVLALLLAVGFTAAAYAEVQNVKVGGDLFIFGVTRYRFDLAKPVGGNFDSGTNNTRTGDIWGSVVRVRIDADLTDNVSTTVRLINERPWSTASDDAAGETTGINLDLAYVTLKEFLYEPLTLVIGRQNLKIGDGLLIADPYTNQTGTAASAFPTGFRGFSQRRGFDAMVAILDYDPLKITAGFVKALEGYTSLETNNHDANVYAVNAVYKTDILGITPELTYVLKEFKKAQTNNYSIRVVATPLKDLTTKGEFVYQSRKGIRADDEAAADNAYTAAVDYVFSEVKFMPSIGVDFMHLSRNWDPLYESVVTGDILNGFLANSNQQVFGINLSAKPTDDITLKLRYLNDRLPKTVGDTDLPVWGSSTGAFYQMQDKHEIGNELDAKVIYDYTEDVQFGFNVAYFIPGSAFDSVNRESATQVLGTMKVTF